jgi:hypothetical protein
MANKKIMWRIFGAALVFGFLAAGCPTTPPVRPAVSQAVINIQRGSTKLDTGDIFIYVDDMLINKKTPIKKGQFLSYPVNNGVHYIYAARGKLRSEAINFTASSETVSFVVTIENDRGKRKLVVNRSIVSNETGSQTNLDIQESYGNVQ